MPPTGRDLTHAPAAAHEPTLDLSPKLRLVLPAERLWREGRHHWATGNLGTAWWQLRIMTGDALIEENIILYQW